MAHLPQAHEADLRPDVHAEYRSAAGGAAPYCKNAGACRENTTLHAQSEWLACGIWYARNAIPVSSMLQRKQRHGMPTMTALLLALAAGAANVALVAVLADRLGPKAAAAGELFAVNDARPASARVDAVKAGNENAPAVAAKRAA
ncbi:hypothetical protein [Methylobacterium durans]|uniref:hypothetical protein n=1 Tax=Methylobacterium durans TaxID=2202825 RepID=UPI001F301633|nr:hypothetical protein [Methylobacterium durans]